MELARASKYQPPELSRAQQVVIMAMADGYKPNDIARKLAKGDPAKAKRWRGRIRTWLAQDPTFKQAIGLAAQAQLVSDILPATAALGRRAARGRTDAIRLLYEASGFHNPKVQHNHEHSGTIDINLKMGGRPEPVVDAEVVEE
jgi:hypothetical protein